MRESHEIIATVLEILKTVSSAMRVDRRIALEVNIGDNGGMAPEIAVNFHGPYWSDHPILAEISVWRGTNEFEAKAIMMAFNENADEILHEIVDLKEISSDETCFEKILTLYPPHQKVN